MKTLPDGWKKYNIKDIGTVVTGNTPPKNEPQNYDGNLPWIKPPDLDNGMFVSTSVDTISEFGRKKIRSLPKGSVLVSCIGNIGKVAIAECELCTNQQINSIIPNREIVDSVFLYYAIKKIRPKLEEAASSFVVSLLNKTDFSNIELSFPPLPTQMKIAAVLEKAEETKKLRAQVDELTDRLLQSVFLELFGDTMKNPKGWEIKNMGTEIIDIRYGTGSPPEYQKEGIPFIRATNIKKGTVQKEGLVYISKEEANKIKKCEVKTGDLILVRSGVNTGDCARIPPEYDGAYAGYDLVIQMTYPKNYYFNFIINSDYGKSVIKPLSRRAGQPHINADQVKSLQFPLPSVQLLEKFARIVEKVESMRQAQKQSLQEIDNLFNTFMQKAFKGELLA